MRSECSSASCSDWCLRVAAPDATARGRAAKKAGDRAGRRDGADRSPGQGVGLIGPAPLKQMPRDHQSSRSSERPGRSLPGRLRDDVDVGLRAAAARVRRKQRVAPDQVPGTVAASDALTRKRRSPKVRSAREDRIRGRIDKLAGQVLEAFGRLTGRRSARLKGRAARARGAGRSTKGRLKRHLH